MSLLLPRCYCHEFTLAWLGTLYGLEFLNASQIPTLSHNCFHHSLQISSTRRKYTQDDTKIKVCWRQKQINEFFLPGALVCTWWSPGGVTGAFHMMTSRYLPYNSSKLISFLLQSNLQSMVSLNLQELIIVQYFLCGVVQQDSTLV